jgi:hypothetical protein
MEEILLALVGRVVADYGVSFSSACLSVSEDGGIDAFEELPDGVLDQQKHVSLSRLGGEYVVEFHVRVVAGPTNFQGVILHGAGCTSSRWTNMLGSSSLRTGRMRIMILSLSSQLGRGIALEGLRVFI